MGNRRTAMPARQKGVALITAMLVVAIAATTAAYLSLDQQIWLRQEQNLSDRSQAEVVRAAALEWASIILAKDAKDTQTDDLTENWSKPLPALAVEGGQVTGRMVDAQGRFNINNLVLRSNASDRGVFRNMLDSLSLDPNLIDGVIDWMDGDQTALPNGAEDIYYLQLPTPYRTADNPMQSIDELRLVRGFTPEIVEKLRPWIIALPVETDINVNTALPDVLTALFYPQPTAVIEKIVSNRPYKNPAELMTKVPELAAASSKTALGPFDVKSGFFEVEIETLFGRYHGATLAMIQRQPGGGPTRVLWHRQWLPVTIAASDAKPGEKSGTTPDGNI
jgi:general secretion pathway protein K